MYQDSLCIHAKQKIGTANMEDGEKMLSCKIRLIEIRFSDKCKHCKNDVCSKDRHVTMVTTA